MKYIMVTKFSGHWDSLIKDETRYSLGMLKSGIKFENLVSNAETLFIKKDDNKQVEKTWVGNVSNFRKEKKGDKDYIFFKVSINKEIDCPDEYKHYTEGWYLDKGNASTTISSNSIYSKQEHLQPAFFKEMGTCDSATFELHCFHLLRLLGVHDIHKFPLTDNRGKADGFFCFNTLSVIYDATLETNYQKKKETQIENYVNQLKKEKIPFGTNSYTIKDKQRQVWIITRGSSVRQIRNEDQIKVKEIPYTKLIEVYHNRLNNEIVLDELWDILKDLN